jgi:hypothetical protein
LNECAFIQIFIFLKTLIKTWTLTLTLTQTHLIYMQIVKTLTLIEKSLTLTQIVVKFEQIFY